MISSTPFVIGPDIHNRGGQPGISGIEYVVWNADHPMYRKEENSDTEGDEKEEPERDRAQAQ